MSLFLVVMIMLSTQAFAVEVPVSQTEAMIDGRQTLTKIFEVPADTDPQTLIEYGLTQNGFSYIMTSIVKDPMLVTATKEITQTETMTIAVSDEDDARLEALMSMPAFIEYDQDGYTGKLYPVISSLTGEESGRTNHSGYKTTTKTYTFDYNDDSLVPASSDGYSLSSVTWAEGDLMANSSIPENYVATASYKKYYSYSTIDGWNFSLTYTGDVEYEHEDTVRYTLTYIGSPIEPEEEPSWWERIFGGKKDKDSDHEEINDAVYAFTSDGKATLKRGGMNLANGERVGFGNIGLTTTTGSGEVYVRVNEDGKSLQASVPQGSVLVVAKTDENGNEVLTSYPNSGSETMYLTVDENGSVQQSATPPDSLSSGGFPWKTILGIGCVIIAIVGVAGCVFLAIKLIHNNTVDVYVRDDVTGDYTKIKSTYYDHKNSSVHINPLDNPSVTNYRLVFKSSLASDLKGKVITIDTGKNPIKHQVGDSGGSDYVAEVNL